MASSMTRQRLFMSALLRASKRQNSVVPLREVCDGLKMKADECGEVVRWAEKAGLLNKLGNDEAILTATGRDWAEALDPK